MKKTMLNQMAKEVIESQKQTGADWAELCEDYAQAGDGDVNASDLQEEVMKIIGQ